MLQPPASKNDDDAPLAAGVASAASMITLNLMGTKFKPVYTHQLFKNETIRGYEPTEEAAAAARSISDLRRKGENTGPPHKSYEHHVTATHRLSIDVRLAPSCRSCTVDFHERGKTWNPPSKAVVGRRRARKARQQSQQQLRRLRADSSEESPFCSGNNDRGSDGDGDESYHEESSSSRGSDAEETGDDGSSSSICSSSSVDVDFEVMRMSHDQVLEVLKRALPPVFVPNNSCRVTRRGAGTSKRLEDDFLPGVLGRTVCEYDLEVPRGESELSEEREEQTLRPTTRSRSSNGANGGGNCAAEGNETGIVSREHEGRNHFVVSIADGSDRNVAAYHNQVQNLALWFIETADSVDLTQDEGGGCWKVLYLFRRHKAKETTEAGSNTNATTMMGGNRKRKREPSVADDGINSQWKYSLVGYMTLFFFNSPFKKPKPGLVIRICQALVLPPYHRSGHGKKMLQAIYRIAMSDPKIVEITVEDPAPGCIALRNRLDYELLRDSIRSHAPAEDHTTFQNGSCTLLEFSPEFPVSNALVGPLIPAKYTNENGEDDIFLPLPESEAIRAAALIKLTPKQIQVAYEIHKLASLQKCIANTKGDDATKKEELQEALEKKYRLMVKKRLLKSHKEELGSCPSKEAKQKMLAEHFDESLALYGTILKRT